MTDARPRTGHAPLSWTHADRTLDVEEILSSNLLISGHAGVGKTVAARGLVTECREQGWTVYVIDLLGGRSYPNLDASEMATTLEDARDLLVELDRDLRQRETEDNPAENREPVLLVVDDAHVLLSGSPNDWDIVEESALRHEAIALLGRIATDGGPLGIRTVLIAQQLGSVVWGQGTPIDRALLENTSRLLVGSSSAVERMFALHSPAEAPAEYTGARGTGIWEQLNGTSRIVHIPHA